MSKTIVLFHKACNDGIAAAWAVNEVLPTRELGEVQYIPYQYGDELPLEIWGNHVIMVDLSLPPAMFEAICVEVASILIIDHHKTAEALSNIIRPVRTYSEYRNLRMAGKNTFLYLDKRFSGAVLAWAFFNDIEHLTEETPIPQALTLIQDYDLWRHKLVETRSFNAWLAAGPRTIERFSSALNEDGSVKHDVIEAGRTLVEYDHRIALGIARQYTRSLHWNGREVATVNAPAHLRNEVADILLADYDMVVCYTVRKDKIVYSLRSNEDVDVRAIAEEFGGGGHHTAAAFTAISENGELKALQWLHPKPTFWQRLKRLFRQ